MLCCIGRGEARHGECGGEEFDGVGDASGVGFRDENLVAPVVIHGWSSVPAGCAVCGPRGTFAGLIVSDNADAGRREGRAIVVKVTEELRVGGELGVDSRGAK